MKSCESIVIGAGIIGLSVTDWLNGQGTDVYCLDGSHPGSGQSAGRVRVFRYLHDDPELINLAKNAYDGWHSWQDRFGVTLLHEVGRLSFAPNTLIMHNLLQESKVKSGLIDKSIWGNITPTHGAINSPALYENVAGAIEADTVIERLVSANLQRIVRQQVKKISKSGFGFQINTNKGIWRCNKLIIAAGVDTPQLAQSIGITIDVEERLHCRLTFSVKNLHTTIPCISDSSNQYDEHVYGSPTNTQAYVLGLSKFNDNLLPDHIAELPLVRRRIIDYARKAMPMLGDVIDERLCTTTRLTNKGDDAFEVFKYGNSVAIAGNNLFKFAPILGKHVSETLYK